MDTNSILIIVLVVVVVLAIRFAIYSTYRYQRIRHLHQHFGPEYERPAQETGSAQRAERELEAREKRVHKFNIRALTSEEQAHFCVEWLPFDDRRRCSNGHSLIAGLR